PPIENRRRVLQLRGLDNANVLRLVALLTLADVELDALPLVERLVAVTRDVGVVDEEVFPLVTRDEAVTLLCVEELHCALCHFTRFLDVRGGDSFALALRAA